MASQPVSGEKKIAAIFKDLARGVIPGVVTWALAAVTGTIAAVSARSQTGTLPLTTLTYFVLAGRFWQLHHLASPHLVWMGQVVAEPTNGEIDSTVEGASNPMLPPSLRARSEATGRRIRTDRSWSPVGSALTKPNGSISPVT
jgi:hypothetical protein